MKRVINITDTLQREYAKKFKHEHSNVFKASPLGLNHLHTEFEYFNGKIFKLIGVVDEDKFCVLDIEENEFYHVERMDFRDFILSGYINKTEKNEL